ncbi:MAG: UDP-N-acetylglucosamine 2-epimerase (non-hydrolyzing) [Acidobacteriota bacterium]|nr:UDP-N-acetylglucosamine 2-epimerase (non-hydrolyzing) [Acidobacteriota bacterium]
MKIAIVLGTRPEAIKLAPVARRFLEVPHEFETCVIVTAQHRGLLDQTLHAFAITPDYDLDVMRPGQTLAESTSRVVAALDPVLAAEVPDLVIVQGDTTTTFCGALGAFYRGVPVAHVEAGLRTGDFRQPFPEEMNRVLTARLAALHFAPTETAAANLRREGVDARRIFITGNTGIDAVLETRDALAEGRLRAWGLPELDAGKKLVLVTAHRRESFGEGFEGICEALVRLAGREDVQIVYPVHPNPNVRGVVERRLGGIAAIHLIEPLGYVAFVDLMRRAHVLLTDSGGIQEEAPSLGKPVLVLREKTERPEAVLAGAARLTGTDPGRILAEAELLLDDAAEYARRAAIVNPYGDGCAATRILGIVRSYLARLYPFEDGRAAASGRP